MWHHQNWFFEIYKKEIRGHGVNDDGDMTRLSYVDFNRSAHFRLMRQKSDGTKVQEPFTLWEWIYHAFELLNMPSIRKHWNHGFIGLITLQYDRLQYQHPGWLWSLKVGFISKNDTQQRLMNQNLRMGETILEDQSAIIRFSDSCLGAISVAKRDQGQVTHCHVLRIRDLIEESLYQVLVELQGRPKTGCDVDITERLSRNKEFSKKLILYFREFIGQG